MYADWNWGMKARSLKRARRAPPAGGFDRGKIDGSLVADKERRRRRGKRRQLSRRGVVSQVDGVPEPDGQTAVRAVVSRTLDVVLESERGQAFEKAGRVPGSGPPEPFEEAAVGGEDCGKLGPDVQGAPFQAIKALSIVIPSDDCGKDER